MLDPAYVRERLEEVRTGLTNRGLDPAAILEPGPALAGGSWQLSDVSACWKGVHAAVAVDSTVAVTITTIVPEEGHP